MHDKNKMTKEIDKKSNKKNNLHDQLFKEAFSHVGVTIDLLKHHLPLKLLKKIDTRTLQLTNKSFITEEFTEKHSDLIYKAKIDKTPGYIYFLIESQSTNDKYMGIILLEYNIQLMRQHMKEQKTIKAPIVLNLLIYAGKKPYNGPKNILEIFKNQSWQRI